MTDRQAAVEAAPVDTAAPSAGFRQRDRFQVGTLVLMLALAGMVTVNVWLLSSQLREMAARSRERAFWELCHRGNTPRQRVEDFLQLAADGNTEWQSAQLDGLDLTGADLSGAQLESARFRSCTLTDANLREAVLNQASLDNSDLTRTSFSNAKLRNATLFKSVLTETDFRNAELLSVSLEQAKAHGAVFVAARMGDAFLAMADLTGADFTGADLSGANLEAAVLKNADLALANLFGAGIVDVDFTDSNWWRTRGLTSAQLDQLTLEFPPTPNAPESRRRDFEIWLTKRLGDAGNQTRTPQQIP
ncbi:MAG: pentapeptide repeat-containing protein [Fuerstiella sp.]